MHSCAPSLIPTPRVDWPPDSGLWVAILMTFCCALTGTLSGSSNAATSARTASVTGMRDRFILCSPSSVRDRSNTVCRDSPCLPAPGPPRPGRCLASQLGNLALHVPEALHDLLHRVARALESGAADVAPD